MDELELVQELFKRRKIEKKHSVASSSTRRFYKCRQVCKREKCNVQYILRGGNESEKNLFLID